MPKHTLCQYETPDSRLSQPAAGGRDLPMADGTVCERLRPAQYRVFAAPKFLPVCGHLCAG
jgi:hypothetical protein